MINMTKWKLCRKIWRQDVQVYQSLGPTIAALTLGSTDPQAPPLSQSTSTTITTTKYCHNHYQWNQHQWYLIHSLHLFLNIFMISTNKIMIDSSPEVASYKLLIRRIPIIVRPDVRQHLWQMCLTTSTISFIGWNIPFELNSSERHHFPLCITQYMLNSLLWISNFFCP